MNLREHSLLFWTVIGICTLLVASPALHRLLGLPQTEFFTELWILDSNHKAEDYPFNITSNHDYQLFLGIGNHLGYSAYYKIEVKFRNQNQSAPDSFNMTPSSLPSLYNITVIVEDEKAWEYSLRFSLDYGYNESLSRIELHNMVLNDVTLNMENYFAVWDSQKSGFFSNLFFELWIYNDTIGSFQYHERYVGLWLNMTTL